MKSAKSDWLIGRLIDLFACLLTDWLMRGDCFKWWYGKCPSTSTEGGAKGHTAGFWISFWVFWYIMRVKIVFYVFWVFFLHFSPQNSCSCSLNLFNCPNRLPIQMKPKKSVLFLSFCSSLIELHWTPLRRAIIPSFCGWLCQFLITVFLWKTFTQLQCCSSA